MLVLQQNILILQLSSRALDVELALQPYKLLMQHKGRHVR